MQTYEDWRVDGSFLSTYRDVMNPSSSRTFMTVSGARRMLHESDTPKGELFRELPYSSIGPYDGFVRDLSRERYIQNLKDRGMDVRKAAPPDRGHPWELTTIQSSCPQYSGSLRTSAGVTAGYYDRAILLPPSSSALVNLGQFRMIPGSFEFSRSPSDYPSSGDLENFAQRAIVKTAPTPDHFDLARFIGELREGLPKLAISSLAGRAKRARAAGSDYLNVEFGWRPLVADLKSIIDVLTKSTSLINGLPIPGEPLRRVWGVPVQRWSDSITGTSAPQLGIGVRSSSTDFNQYCYNPSAGNWSGGMNIAPISYTNHSWRVAKTRSVDRWFTGSYSYFLPMGFDASSYLDRVMTLTKVSLTPELLWELSPFSWLADWALHLGDSLKANELAVSELLHIHYAYAMEQTVDTIYTDINLFGTPSGSIRTDLPRYIPSTWTRTRKKRIKANPFGFTTGSTGGLNPRQLAILAALGLSKS